jgi:hypothetical protein
MPSQPPPISPLRLLRNRIALEGMRFCGAGCGAGFGEDAEGSYGSWGGMGEEADEGGGSEWEWWHD